MCTELPVDIEVRLVVIFAAFRKLQFPSATSEACDITFCSLVWRHFIGGRNKPYLPAHLFSPTHAPPSAAGMWTNETPSWQTALIACGTFLPCNKLHLLQPCMTTISRQICTKRRKFLFKKIKLKIFSSILSEIFLHNCYVCVVGVPARVCVCDVH